MTSTSVHLDLEGAVASITLDRPFGNRIDFAMRESLREAVRSVEASTARALMIKGAGPDFCRGGDVREWVGVPSSALRPKIEVFAEGLKILRRLQIPTVAVVQGNCRGGGFELALNCDFIIAARSAVFCFPEAASGILTLQGGVMQLAERIGRSKACELVLLREAIGADQLALWSVVNRVVDDDELADQALTFATQLARVSRPVTAATKRLLRIWSDDGPEAAMANWYDIAMPLFDLEPTQAALRSTAESLQQQT